jgi:hypothetical protein
MDFRADAVAKTFRLTQDSSGSAMAELNESGCVAISGGRRILYLVEIPFLLVSLLPIAAAVVVFVLSSLNLLSRDRVLLILLAGLAVGLLSRMIKSQLLKLYLRLRFESLLRVFKDLPMVNVGVENGATHKKIKMLIEDEGVCLLDAPRQRILIEGCSHRYVIYARDIYSLEPISGYAMSGARLKCRMAGEDFDLALMVRGHGPIASLVQTFSPATGATSLAVQLTQTLFHSDIPSYHQTALPPPLPLR